LAWVSVDPFYPSGQVNEPLQRTGISKGFNDDPNGSDVAPLLTPYCAGNCNYRFVPGATAECIAQLVDPVADGSLGVGYARQNALEVLVGLFIDATDQCEFEFKTPGLNANLYVYFRQRCENGALLPVEFRAEGEYDGYPWFEVYLNGSPVFFHDPCVTGEGPISLFPPMDHAFQNHDGGPPPTGIDIWAWQFVP
jgi:hypothetical protein